MKTVHLRIFGYCWVCPKCHIYHPQLSWPPSGVVVCVTCHEGFLVQRGDTHD